MDDEINIKESIDIVWRQRKFIAYFTLALTLFALFFSLMQTPLYETKTVLFLQAPSASSNSSVAARYASLLGKSGDSMGGDLKQLLFSYAVAERLLDRMDLYHKIGGWDRPNINKQSLISAVRGFLRKGEIDGNFMEIKVQFSDPDLAVELADGFVQALAEEWNNMNYTEAKGKQAYIERQLPEVETNLKLAEKQVKQLDLLMGMGSLSSSKFQGVEVTKVVEDYKLQNSIYLMLRTEYENTKLEASKEVPPFSVVDKAIRPTNKVSPKTKMNVLGGFVLGLFLSVFIVFFFEYWRSLSA